MQSTRPRNLLKTLKKLEKPLGPALSERQKKSVKRIVNARNESKVNDTAVLSIPSATGLCLQLTLPIQGDGYNERIGDTYYLESIAWNLDFIFADVTNVVRVILFKWHTNTALTLPVPADVLQAVNPFSFVNYQNTSSGQVQIIHDEIINLTMNGDNASVVRRRKVFGQRLGRKKIGTNNGVASGYGEPFVLLISDSAAVTHPAVTGFYRITYSDS